MTEEKNHAPIDAALVFARWHLLSSRVLDSRTVPASVRARRDEGFRARAWWKQLPAGERPRQRTQAGCRMLDHGACAAGRNFPSDGFLARVQLPGPARSRSSQRTTRNSHRGTWQDVVACDC